MLQTIFGSGFGRKLALLAVLSFLLFGCATVPDTTVVGEAVLPDYKVGGHRVEVPIDLYIEPRIRSLRRYVTPHSEDESFNAIPVVVGPVLETALLSVTEQHFSQVTPVNAPDGRPTLSYKLLDYRPIVSVVPGFFSTRLNVSARLALQVSVHSASGEQLFSTTAIGTSHVSDTEIAAGDGLKDGSRLLEVATRDAITDTLYNISGIFGNRSGKINDDVRASATNPGMPVETMDDVVMHLRTWREADSGD